MKRPRISFGSTKTHVVLAGTSVSSPQHWRNISQKSSSVQHAGVQKYFFFQLVMMRHSNFLQFQVPLPKTDNIFQTVKQKLFVPQTCLLQLHHPQILTPEQQTKVYRSKISPGAKVLWKDDQKKIPHLYLIQSVDNNQVSMTQIHRRGEIPSLNPQVKVVNINQVIGGRAKDATIPITLSEQQLGERIRLLFPTHINSLKFFCKNSKKSCLLNLIPAKGNFKAFASEMIWRDEGDKTQVKLRVVPTQDDVVDPKQGQLVTAVRSLMTIVIDGEPIPVFVHEKDAMTLAEGRKKFFQRAGLAIITILCILSLLVLFVRVEPIRT